MTRGASRRLVPFALLLAGCTGHGDHVQEGIDSANEKMARMRAAADYDLARQQFRSGELQTALETIDRVVAVDGRVPHGHVLRGRILIEHGRAEEALASFDRALELDATVADTHYYRGVCLERLGRPDDACSAFEKAAELDPTSHQSVLAAAEVLVEEGRADEARALLDSREEYRWVGGFRQMLGHMAMMNGDAERAILHFGEAVTLDPNDASFREDLARAQIVAGRYRDAEANLAMLRQDEERAQRRDLKHLHAACLLELDEPVQARSILYELTRGDGGKNDLAAWRKLADVAMILDDEGLLRRVARRLIAIAPSEPHGYLTFALWQRRQGNLEGAIESVQEAKLRASGEELRVVTQLEELLESQRGA
ncbi:MAG: tetratricopeptide repeat protein [Planctomycetota bacterium JB042]